MEKELPSETATRNIVIQLSEREENRVNETLQDKQIFAVIDETEINGQNFINCLFGDVAVPAVKILSGCCPIQNSISSTIVAQIEMTLTRSSSITTETSNEQETSTKNVIVRKMVPTNNNLVLLRTSGVKVINPSSGRCALVYAQHDTALQVTLISEWLSNELGLK